MWARVSVFVVVFNWLLKSQWWFLHSALQLKYLAHSRHLKLLLVNRMQSNKSGCIVVQEIYPNPDSYHARCAQDAHTSSPRDYGQKGQCFLIQSVASTKHGNNLQSGQMPLENVIHCIAYDLYWIWVWRSSSQYETR